MDRETRRAQHNQRVKSFRDRGLLTPEEIENMVRMAGGGDPYTPALRFPGYQPPGVMGDDELQHMAELADGGEAIPDGADADLVARMVALVEGGATGATGARGGGMTPEQLDRMAALAGGVPHDKAK